MGYLQRISSVAAPARMRANGRDYQQAFFSGGYLPEPWVSQLSAAGVNVTPELALTLTAMYDGVTTIAMDMATLPAHVFRLREDGGKDRVRPYFGDGIDTSGGIRSLAYMLRWQPNTYQTAAEFLLGMLAQFLLRGRAYAEIVFDPRTGFMTQLLPRHPDRIKTERLPSGRLRYRLDEGTAAPRFLIQEEMLVVRDLSLDGGITSVSRIQYGAQAIGAAIATSRAAGRFFKTGMTASTVATYTGEMDPEHEKTLHESISRYAAGVENSFGLLLIPDDVKISNLGVEPEKAQMMLVQEWGVREVARLLRLPGHKLGIKDAVSYNSQVQGALDYIISCLRPIAVLFEQAMQRDLVQVKDAYLVEFQLAALMRGDFESQANYLEKLIRNRVMRPSEARLILNMNPDSALDLLSEGDMRPGTSGTATAPMDGAKQQATSRPALKAMLVVTAGAVSCVRRERAAVEKLAKKHAADVSGWQAGLRDFYADHAGFVAQTMGLSPDVARSYAAQHGSVFEASGVAILDGDSGAAWERDEAADLAALVLDVAA